MKCNDGTLKFRLREIMSEHSISSSSDGMRQDSVHWNGQIWPLYDGFARQLQTRMACVQLRQRGGFQNFFHHLCQSVYGSMLVLKLNVVVEIEVQQYLLRSKL